MQGTHPAVLPAESRTTPGPGPREAKADKLCATCPVQEPCRSHARNNHEYGYWAGESEEDRHLAGFTVSAPIGVRARLQQQTG